MAIAGNATCDVFKLALATGAANFNGPFYLALYTNDAAIGPATTAYTVEGEASGGDYTPGGVPLAISTPATLVGGTVYLSFDNVSWAGQITARGALIYTPGDNGAVCVLDFGSDKTSAVSFTVQFPAATATSAILRLN